MKKSLIGAALALAAAASQAGAGDILLAGRDWRAIPFEVTDLRPMIRVRVGGRDGRMMFDTGTPDAVFFNRDAAPLDAGIAGTTGSAASGQTVTTRRHAPPVMEIAGATYDPSGEVRSGGFDFVEAGLGEDFLGFIGTPMVEGHAFALDYGRQVLTIFRAGADGQLAVPPPDAAETLARIDFLLWPGEQPTTAARLGQMPILMDLDTGDSGTIYLRPETRQALLADGTVRPGAEGLVLTTVTFGGATFADLSVRAVDAGGPEDFRRAKSPDLLRLGARFLSRHPSVWNFPQGTITILRPDSAFLAPR
jgi:hypothetical protein